MSGHYASNCSGGGSGTPHTVDVTAKPPRQTLFYSKQWGELRWTELFSETLFEPYFC